MHFHKAWAFTHHKDAVLKSCSTLLSCPNNTCAIIKQMKMSVRVRLNSHKTDLEDQSLTSTKHKLNDNTEVSVHDVLTHRHHLNSKLKLFILTEIRDTALMHDDNYGKTSDMDHAVPSPQELKTNHSSAFTSSLTEPSSQEGEDSHHQ